MIELPQIVWRSFRPSRLAAIVLLCATALGVQSPGSTIAQERGVEIKIGNTMPYSGALSAYGTMGRLEAAYFQKVNRAGGIAGRMIRFISLDDGYNPSKTVEQTRRLVEQDGVSLMFSSFGTANIGAVQKYLADRKVPQIFFVSGARKWEDRRRYSWMVGWQPTYHREGMIFAHYLLRARPQARIGVLYQNDDYGRDYLQGLKDGLGAKADASIVSELTYQASDPTIESQIVTLKASGADVFIDIAAAKFAAQAIRKTHEIGWKPLHLLNSVSSSISAVLEPAGLESSVGIVSTAYVKDPTDPQFEGDAGIREYLDFVRREFPEGGAANMQNANAYARSMAFAEVLRRCGDDLSPDNIVRKAQALDFENPMLLPGIRLRSADNDTDIGDLQLQRFNGHGWEGLADQPDLSSDGRR